MERCTAIWIDLLPFDICTQVVSRTCANKQNEAALCLAQVSRKQHDVVDRLLQGPLTISTSTFYEPHRFFGHIDDTFQDCKWPQLFPNREICIKASNITPAIEQLFQTGRVVEAIIDAADKNLLQATCDANSVRTLSVRFWNELEFEQVSDMLNENIRSLKVTSIADNLNWRFFNGNTALEFQGLATCLPFLHHMQLENMTDLDEYEQYDFAEDPFSNWSGIIHLPRFIALDIVEEPPQDILPILATFKQLSLHGIEAIFARALKNSVVEYHSTGMGIKNCEEILLDTDMLQGLAVCKNIRVLHIKVLIQHQNAVPELCKQLPNLEHLSVSWFWHSEDNDISRPRPWPNRGLILKTLQSCPKVTLTEIGVCWENVTEIKQVLKEIGSRVKDLCLSMRRERQNIELVVEQMFLSLLENAECLEKLVFLGIDEEYLSENEKARLVLLGERLHRKLPMLNNGNPEEAFRFFRPATAY